MKNLVCIPSLIPAELCSILCLGSITMINMIVRYRTITHAVKYWKNETIRLVTVGLQPVPLIQKNQRKPNR